MMKFIKYLFCITIIGISFSCVKKETSPPKNLIPEEDDNYTYQVPSYFPKLNYPHDNPPTKSKFLLGKKLFFDKLLSKDNSVSCASCHSAHLAFSDSIQYSTGTAGQIGERNSPTLTNIGYNARFFWDGGVPSLELQALAPLDNHKEFNLPYDSLVFRLKKNAIYREMFKKTFNQEPDLNTYCKALACYQRAMISGNSKFDEYHYKGNTHALSPSELNGYNLFFSDLTNCSDCHSGFNFTSGGFENNGLYLHYPDQGRYKITGYITDLAKFKVPTLRNIALTAPYMHDGSILTLANVIEHYNQGGKGHSNQSKKIKPLNLNAQQKTDLINFLKTLTDEKFITNKELKE